MKQFLILIFILFFLKSTSGQTTNVFFNDNNPKLTIAESQWLTKNFKIESYDFTNKYIGFVELLSGGFYGIGKFTLPLKKKILTQFDLSKYNYKLIVLDSTEKQITRGYDALIVLVLKKNKRKLERLNKEKLISESKNRYPQIPIDAGIDSNEKLNYSNAIFFNEIYKADLYPKTDFDFAGKKVAILNSYCQYNKLEKVKLSEYVDRIKSQLDQYGFSMTEVTYYLSAEQKQECGGYDVIIQYRCKKDIPLTDLIKFLKQNGI